MIVLVGAGNWKLKSHCMLLLLHQHIYITGVNTDNAEDLPIRSRAEAESRSRNCARRTLRKLQDWKRKLFFLVPNLSCAKMWWH